MLILAGYLYYKAEYKIIRENAFQKIKTISNFKLQQLAEWKKERTADAIHFSTSPLYAKAVDELIKKPDSSTIKQIITRNKLIANLRGFESVFIFSPKYKLLIADNISANDISQQIYALADSALRSQQSLIADFYKNGNSKFRTALISPIINSQNKAIAVLVFYINPGTYLSRLTQFWPSSDKTAETMLIKKENDSIVILNRPRHTHSIVFQEKMAVSDFVIPLNTGEYEGIDFAGKKVIANIQLIPGTRWLMINKVDQQESFSELRYRKFSIGTIVFILFLLFNSSFAWIYYSRETKRKKTELDLQEKTSEFDQFFQNSMEMLCIADTDGFFRRLNPQWEHNLGYSLDELLGKRFIEFVHPEDVDTTLEATQKLANDEKITNFINRYKHKNGSYRWIEWRSYAKNNIIHAVARDVTDKIEAEKALQQSEKKYRMLFENMTSGFALHQMIYDQAGEPADYRYIEANPAFYNLTSIPYGIMVGKTVKEVLPTIEEQWIQAFGKVAKTGEPITYTNYAHDLNKYYETYVFSPEKDYFAVVFNDITEKVAAENKLKESEKKFSDIFNLSPNIVGISQQSNGLILDANEAFTKITGYSRDEFIGSTSTELNLWIDEKERINSMHILKANGEVNNYEIQMRAKDGSAKTCLFSARPIIFNNTECIIFSIADITEFKKVKADLRQAKKYTDAIIESIPGLLYLYDTEGHLLSWNKRHETDTGYSAEELSHMHLLDWYKDSPKDIEIITAGVQRAFADGYAFAEGNLQKKNGEKVTYYFTAVKIEIEGKTYITGIGIDINERKKAEEALLFLNENLERKVAERTTQLEQANRDLESFAYSVSHDLRSPLRHIDGFVKLLYSTIEKPNESAINYFQKINHASKRMSAMIDDLLSFSRLGRKELSFAKLNLDSIIHEIIELFKPDTANRQITWHINPLPEINGDKNLLKIAFENLISNAIKYTSRKNEAVIEIGCLNDQDSTIEIYIKDNGVGFDMAYASKLFGVFQRLHTSEEFEGTGIGLANVKQIITKHHGSIRAEGNLNEGAIFYIILPK